MISTIEADIFTRKWKIEDTKITDNIREKEESSKKSRTSLNNKRRTSKLKSKNKEKE